jgi:hypothetical protein
LLIKATLFRKLAGMTNAETEKKLPRMKIHTKILAAVHVITHLSLCIELFAFLLQVSATQTVDSIPLSSKALERELMRQAIRYRNGVIPAKGRSCFSADVP